ncbi:hypothetical protein DW322_15270 [Rhodococcus rhodnii]|uniref:Lipoprotein n=2 Tax=Rhodococcus rhodnii TaxID=38312 RepID=R7WTC9_9NOCA|nr:LppA family lipoprotein [Rhodococcus rhodnii]EOM78530.1 hypothetical protein Rrhod_0067 [Rhodococcus rhodnii LMG 5362]TXG91319.1 hypothetical protein DW322_15270 [Rhodococcus rhodnii]
MLSARLRIITATLVVVTSLTGCGALANPYETTGPEDTARAAERLADLPSLESTEADGQRIAEELGTYITGLAPRLAWEWVGNRRQRGCSQPFDQTPAKNVKLRDYLALGPLPDRNRSEVLERARELAAEVGATNTESFHDEPGNLDIRFYSNEGTALTLMIGDNTLIGIDTGCRLPQAAFDPVTPNPPTPTP